jgi:organic radical activating enzyme
MSEDFTLLVSEIFTSIQGEGPTTGTPAHFIRLAGCSLACSWCDTKHSWNGGDRYNKGGIISSLTELKEKYPEVKKVVITGGEPMEQNIVPLIELMAWFEWSTEIETHGLAPYNLGSHLEFTSNRGPGLRFNISPKIHIPELRQRYLKENLTGKFSGVSNTTYKFVAENEKDVDDILRFCAEVGIRKYGLYIMPKCTNKEELDKVSPEIIDACIKHGVKFCNRLHIQVWDGKRGV